ncbi:hypothetical protein QBC37DRAFT_367097 [Rhypophila decipiens]|uniref:Uncharacterized protein n=1 Tax=Rhypophila decipiens TaxID=261697 RepID=A0AAN6YIT2_9PEZI|nr:hypothetical protein QBC37DRAFT_367097 [Rhypophila decipiens]
MNQHSGSASLPRGFRLSDVEAPKTPEPFAQNDEAKMPSPPKPRLRLKRRVVSQVAQLTAPTQHFLASVAAADVPIPSIEVPESDPMDSDLISLDALHHQSLNEDTAMLSVHPRGRAFSPPRTPAPDFLPCLSPKRYPQWSIDSFGSVESTPDYESSRPSTARSTVTSSSLFSHISAISDDDHFLGSEVDCKEKYTLQEDDCAELRDHSTRSRKARKAPWTKAMSDHLWSTFTLYLSDPKVTPVRMGKSGIPPQGVCLRVAREAKRSWKGAKALGKAPASAEGRKSGSSTPTAETSGSFIQWPHTCAATRAHLRELCKLKATSGSKKHRFISRSPTPFTQFAARHWNRRSTPARNPSAFTQDMTMSLTLSTSDSMQPQGPLAQLAVSSSELLQQPVMLPPQPPAQPLLPGQLLNTFEGEPSFAERRRLGSPFGARSYGPSSSGSLAAALGITGPMPRRQTHTVGPRRLQSPVRLSRSGTQKRRNTQSSEPRKRPSIGADLWMDPSSASAKTENNVGTEFSSTNELFIPRVPAEPILTTSASMPDVSAQITSPLSPPARLGSPFSASNSSFSFPNRIRRSYQAGSVDLGSLGRSRQFATIQQFPESTTPQPRAPRGNLAGKLAYIDQRLKEIKQRDFRRRSQSPM